MLALPAPPSDLVATKEQVGVDLQLESARIKEDAVEKLPNFLSIKTMDDIIQEEDFGDETTENAFNAISEFNEEMRFLSLNAF